MFFIWTNYEIVDLDVEKKKSVNLVTHVQKAKREPV